MKTLVFCTGFAADPSVWDSRHRLWLHAVLSSGLIRSQILIIDDGSASSPAWEGMIEAEALTDDLADKPVVFFKLRPHLGRHGVLDYPGWFRSFGFAATYAAAYGFEKIIHIESDAFLISRRLQNRFNAFSDGWLSLWTPRYNIPESGIQIMAGSGLQLHRDFAAQPYAGLQGKDVERTIPFTCVDKTWHGDRFEDIGWVPPLADWAMQIDSRHFRSGASLWPAGSQSSVLPEGASVEPVGRPAASPHAALEHFASGLPLADLLRRAFEALRPRCVLEVGPGLAGRIVNCDLICANPMPEGFADMENPRRRMTLCFRGDAGSFAATGIVQAVHKTGIDCLFLNVPTRFECILDAFIGCEAMSGEASVLFIPHCFPLNAMRGGLPAESDPASAGSTAPVWSGDTWKILEILKTYRPDLKILGFDCQPDGLLAIGGLNPDDRTLANARQDILRLFAPLAFDGVFVTRNRQLYPMVSSRHAARDLAEMAAAFWMLRA